MALLGSRRSFVELAVEKETICSECLKKIQPGELALVAIRFGKVKKRVCSEACRLKFDDAYWQERADERAQP